MMLKTSNISAKSFFINALKRNTLLEDRKELLLQIAEAIAKEYTKNEVVNLNFICTHNSRRSQISQVWAFLAANYYKLNINSFSGGTEVTSFHRNTVKTLQKAGFNFQLEDFSHQNPKYNISYSDSRNSLLGFSKLYDDVVNKEPFIAITTCNNADENCPFIASASHRYHLPFVDPKSADGSSHQEAAYQAVNEKIAAEVGFIFTAVKEIIS